MGCECLKMNNLDKEIITQNTEEKLIILKNEKLENARNTETIINSMKTSDRNIEFNQLTKNEIKNTDNSKFISDKINSETALDDNITENKKNTKSLMNKSLNTKKNRKNNNKIINIDKNKNHQPKTKLKVNSNKISNRSIPIDEFSQYIFSHINQIRENPQSFIKNIEEAKAFIEYNKSNKLIYKKNVKVALSEGLPIFEEAISILKICKPMNKLIFEPKLMVNLPDNEEDLLNKNYLKNEIKKMIDKGIPIKAYWRDIIKDPETSFLMMIVDDTLKSGLKRKDILDPNLKYIGICSKNIGHYFICFITFSDCKVK